MPQNTYVALATIQPSGQTSQIVMDSIPSTYTDLVLVSNHPKTGAGSTRIYFNNDSSSGLYSQTVSYANTSVVSGGRETSVNFIYLMDYLSSSTSTANMSIIHIMNYARTDRFKTTLETAGASDMGNSLGVGCWRNTDAITRIDVATGGGTFSSGASFTLYGIKNWGNEETPKATGGYVYSDSTYWYHAFPFSSTFTPNQTLTCDVLTIAGGAGGGRRHAGGGGAGGLCFQSGRSVTSGSKTVTVGAGGLGNQVSVTNGGRGTNGSNSVFDTTTAIGGGAGGAFNDVSVAGGSGGGGNIGSPPGNPGAGGSATQGNSGGATGYGNAGGTGLESGGYFGGGGGGAGAAGQAGNATNGAGDGGAGLSSNTVAALLSFHQITGFGQSKDGVAYFAGGGGGGQFGGQGFGGDAGLGGGGRGVNILDLPNPDINGLAGSGGGGGAIGSGNNTDGYSAGNGGSGIVIIRYTKA